MNIENQIRYTIEHKLLPQWTFEAGMKFIIKMSQDGTQFLSKLYEDISKEQGIESKYTENDFEIKGYTIVPDALYLQEIKMPETKEAVNCAYIYIMFDVLGQHIMYFTLEKMLNFFQETTEDIFVLCGWGPNDSHYNYGFQTTKETEPEKIIQVIVDIYMNNLKK